MTPTPSFFQPLLDIWNAGTIQAIKTPTIGGTIDSTHLITTNKGRYALCASTRNDPDRLKQEHELILWAHQHDIPTPPPLPTPQGDTIVTYKDQIFTLFPFVNGHQVSRDNLQPAHIAAMGSFLAQIHTILADYPTSNVSKRNFEIDPHADREQALADIDRLIKKISAIPSPDHTDQHALDRLTARKKWLQTLTDPKKSAPLTLPFQVIHGDYQETNVFFQNNHVSSIIDWSAYAAPTTWEIARTLHLVFNFRPTPSITFLKTYQQHHPLSLEDLDIATHAYGLKRGHSLWLYEEAYDNGNVRQFITPGGFTPIATDWQSLSPTLQKHLA